jgi:hypothetical protein
MVTLLATERRWYCPNCKKQDITVEARPHTRMHPCPKLRGLLAPMLPAGTRAKVELREREDYVGKEKVRLDPERGRPVMSIVTTRDNGQDAIVFAPTATARATE